MTVAEPLLCEHLTMEACENAFKRTLGDAFNSNVRHLEKKFFLNITKRIEKKNSMLQLLAPTLETLVVKEVLGEGQFGSVFKVVVNLTPSGSQQTAAATATAAVGVGGAGESGGEAAVRVFALKQMQKQTLVDSGLLPQIVREREVSAALSGHPFVLNLVASYQDASSLYLLTNLVDGPELFDLLHP